MDQNLADDSEIRANVDIPLRNKKNEGEKSNKCNQCQYASSVKSSLKSHLKMHSGEKSYKCNQCDFTSSQASNLCSHLKTHSGEKSNKCNQCDFASSRASNLSLQTFKKPNYFLWYLATIYWSHYKKLFWNLHFLFLLLPRFHHVAKLFVVQLLIPGYIKSRKCCLNLEKLLFM